MLRLVREGAVTIAANMAGRGTDILLGWQPRWRWLKISFVTRGEPAEATQVQKKLRAKKQRKSALLSVRQ